MSEPFLAEVKIVGFNFPPRGFATCDGQILPINQNQALFALVGTTYGGDGRVTFALPDLRGRVPIHVGSLPGGQTHTWGERGGEETHSLSTNELPAHRHSLNATAATASSTSGAGARLAPTVSGRRALTPYGAAVNLTPVNGAALGNTGSSQGHNNMQPYLTVNFVIALQGLFPSRS